MMQQHLHHGQSSGLDADGIPDNDDIVIIDPGHTIDLPSTKTYVKDLTINGKLICQIVHVNFICRQIQGHLH